MTNIGATPQADMSAFYFYFSNKIDPNSIQVGGEGVEDLLPLTLFNFGMFCKIEVFSTPNTYAAISGRKVAKDDSTSWRLLRKQDLDNLNQTRKLFCRLVPVFDEAVQNFKVPIIDRYFMIDIDAPASLSLLQAAILAYGAFDNVVPLVNVSVLPAIMSVIGSDSEDDEKDDEIPFESLDSDAAEIGSPTITTPSQAAPSAAPTQAPSTPSSAAASSAPSAASSAGSTGGYSGGGGGGGY